MSSSRSFRSRRLERRAAIQRRAGTLNLVSLMDIFTILVFFLLINSAAVEVLPSPRAMTLPESTAEQRTREAPVVMVTRQQVLLQFGPRTLPVVTVEELAGSDDPQVPELTAALIQNVPMRRLATSAEATGNSAAASADDGERSSRGELNIMADKATPYASLKRLMTTATAAQFSSISLTVLQNPASASTGEGASP